MRLVRFGMKVINMDQVTNITIWPNEVFLWVSASGIEDQSNVRLAGDDVIALKHWLEDNCENARAPMEAEG